jgi:hypothetical protein
MVELAAKRQAEKDALDAKVYVAVSEFDTEFVIGDLFALLHIRPPHLLAPLQRLEKKGLLRSWRALTAKKKGVGPRYYRKVEVAKTGT